MTRRPIRLIAAVAGIPLAFTLGGIAARLMLRSAPHAIAVDLAQPLPVVTAWHGFGAGLWVVLAATVVAAGFCAVVTVIELRRNATPVRGLFLVLTAAATALAAALAWPVTFSSDVYAYAAYGDLAVRGVDPYLRAPAAAGDPIAVAAAWQWGGVIPPCVYGPAFVAIARDIVGVAGQFGTLVTLQAFRLCAALAFLAASAALYAALPRSASGDGRRLSATAAFALNPIALWSAAEGHNDALMLAVALVGAALARVGPAAVGGLTIAFSSLLKAPGIAVGSLLALAAVPRGRVRALGTGLVIGGVGVLAFGSPAALRALSDVGRHSHFQPQFSLQGLAVLAAQTLDPSHAGTVAAVAAILLCCALVVLAARNVLRTREISSLAWLGIAAWLAIPTPYPWYSLWVLPVAVLALEQPPFAALWAATISIVVRYLPDAYGSLSPDQQAVITVIQFAPLLYALRTLAAPLPAKEPAVQ